MLTLIAIVIVAMVGGAVWWAFLTSSSDVRSSGSRRLAFEETFDGPSLADDRWTTCYWWDKRGCTNGSTEERQWFQAENVRVRDGFLELRAHKEPVRASDGRWYPYTSGMVSTGRRRDVLSDRPGFAFQYGEVEARMRMPAGKGLLPALWLLPVTHRSRPEIDIVEVLGDTPASIRFHVHFWDKGNKRDPGHTVEGPLSSSGFHRYGLRWTPEELVWLVDGQVKWRFTDPAGIPHEPMYLLMTLAVGGEWPGNPDASTEFPASLEVDYVRIWEYES